MTRERSGRAWITGLRAAELALCALGATALVLVLVEVSGPVRPAVTFAALLLLPGWTILREVRLDDAVARIALTVALSGSLTALVSLAMAWRGFWHPVPAAVAMLGVSIAVLLLRRPRQERTG